MVQEKADGRLATAKVAGVGGWLQDPHPGQEGLGASALL